MNLDLKNKRAIVCGSSQGIGRASAMELAALGANVTLVARNEAALKEAKAGLPAQSGQLHGYIVADFSFPERVEELAKASVQRFGPVHILVNNTGGPPGGPVTEASTEEFTRAFSAHLLCNHLLAQAVLEGMKNSGFGRIINIISTSVKQPLHNLGVSNTIRAAVASWAKTLANEVGRFGITVNNVLPGATATDRLTGIINNRVARSGASRNDVEKEMISEIPMRRFAEPAEVAAAVAFLASPAAAYVNGINLPVDGGRTGCL